MKIVENFKKLVAPIILLFLGVFIATSLLVRTAYAQTATETVCEGLGAVTGTDGCNESGDSSGLDNTVESVLNILSVFAGVISVIMLVIGGMKFVASRGDSSGITSARNTIIYALAGLILVILAQSIVQFVIQRSTDDTPPAIQRTAPTDVGGRDGPR